MSTSLAAVFRGPDQDLEFRRVPRPQPSGGEILTRVLGCTLCGSDLHTFEGRRHVPVPTVLGHEIVGEIVSYGESARLRDLAGCELRIGDRVAWSIVANCGDCFYCCRGLPQKCLASFKYGHEPLRSGRELSGGLAEHCLLVPGTTVMRLPDELPLAVACPSSCATATMAAAVAAAADLRQRNVCLYGAGLLGLTACAMLRVAGAATIVCVDVNADRLARALQFGATHAIQPDDLQRTKEKTTGRHGYDVVLELSGNPSAFTSGLESIRMGGTVVLVGAVFPTDSVALAPEQIVRRNLTIRGVHNYVPDDLRQAVAFLAQHHQRFPFCDLVDEWFPLESATAAFHRSSDPRHIRVGVRPQ